MQKKQIQGFFLIAIFFLAFFLRFYKLGEIPFGLYQDETAIGYNAFSLLETSRDEHGQFLPLYFKSFGDYKLPVYIYLTTIPVKFLGLTGLAVRFWSAFFGSLTVIFVYFLLRLSLARKTIALFATLLLAINPWHLHYSRATFEVSLSLFLFVLGAWLFQLAFVKKRNTLFVLAVVSFVLVVYTYNLTRLLAPLLLLIFCFVHYSTVKKIPKKIIVLSGIVAFVLLIPFLISFFSAGGVGSARGTLILTSAVVQAKILEFRSYLVSLPRLFPILFFNRWISSFWQYLLNLASYLSVPFFFISGSSHGCHGIGNFGQFYLFELPLIIFGIIGMVKEKVKSFSLWAWWALVTIAVASLTREAPHATRSFFLILPLVIFSAYGLFYFLLWLKSLKKLVKRVAVGLIFISLVIYSLVFYFTSYYVRFPIFYASSWRAADKELALYLKDRLQDFDKIILDQSVGLVYSSILFYQRYSPKEFQETVVWTPDDSEGFSEPEKFGKYEFRKIDWTKDYQKGNLLVVSPEALPDNIKPIKEIHYPQRPVVLAVKQGVFNYPVVEKVYVFVEVKN